MWFSERNKKSGRKEKRKKIKSAIVHDFSFTFFLFSLVAFFFHKIFFFFVKKKGGPLLLMELAFLLRGVGSEVVWITNQKPVESDEVIHSLERKMLDRGVQVNFLLLNFSIPFTVLS